MSDIDVEDELLALAGGGGGGSSDDEASNAGSRERSRSPPAAKEIQAKGLAPATKKTPAKKTPKRRSDDSEDEGEASEAESHSSHGSAPMDESDSDQSDAPPSKARLEDVKYPVEGLYKSEAEKQEILSLGELEREQIIADRAQERERMRQSQLLRHLYTNSQKEEKNKKRKASTDEHEEGQRKTARVRTKIGGTRVGETNSALDTLKRARAEKSDRIRRRENDRDRRKDRSPSYRHSPRSRGSGDSDVEWATTSKRKSRSRTRTPEVPREAPPAELRDIERIRLSRTRFAKVCFYPGFKDAMTGCYVRISIGADPETKQNVYRVAVITGVVEGKPYAVEDDRKTTFVTNQYIVAAHGKAKREWPFIMCSESPFTEAEWNRYIATLKFEGLPLPKKPELEVKIEDINNLVDRPWTETELQKKLDTQKRFRDQFSGAARLRLEQDLVVAKAKGMDERAKEIQNTLDTMSQPRLAFKTSLNPNKPLATPKGPNQQDRLAEINRNNRKINAENVRKAQIKERQKARDIERRIEAGEDIQGDMSRRVKTRMKFMHDVNEDATKPANSGQNSGASTPANGTPRISAQKAPLLPHMAKLQHKAVDKNGLPTIHKVITEDDIIGALDIDIDIEI